MSAQSDQTRIKCIMAQALKEVGEYIEKINHYNFLRISHTAMNYSGRQEEVQLTALVAYADELSRHRLGFVTSTSCCLLSTKAINTIGNLLKNEPKILSVGAGNGLWERVFFEKFQCNIVCTDWSPRNGCRINNNHNSFWEINRVVKMDAQEAVIANPDATVLYISCPDRKSNYAVRSVQSYKGEKILYIGEGAGGYNANREFFKIVNDIRYWHCTIINIPQWIGVHDAVFWYTKVGP